jgi:DNA-binding NarL/FixJ family response regulator
MEKVKVFLSDPQILFREGIHFILSGEDDLEVIGETTSNEDAFTQIQANPPNVIVLSAQDTKAGATDITRRIKRNMPSVFVIITVEKMVPENLFAVIKSGASACLIKDTDPEYLLNIIRIVSQGSYPIMDEITVPGLATMILAEFEDVPALNEQYDNQLAALTARETQVLNTFAEGNTFEQCAAKLAINEDAVRRNVRLIFNKLVSNDLLRNVIEAAQRNMPFVVRTGKKDTRSMDYVTRAEFNEFKEHLMERFKSFIGELS